MRLIRCYIENFGNLHHLSFSFNEQITEVCRINGWGKTTFACFIKSMFFGLDDRKRSMEENERKRYLPWNNGHFGGWLEFNASGKSFRVERFFGGRAAEDSFRLFDVDTGQETTEYSDDIGEKLFHVDQRAFLDSTLYTSDMKEPLLSDIVNVRLSENAGNSIINQFRDAFDRLTAKEKSYVKTGDRGNIASLKNRIYENKDKLSKVNHTLQIAGNRKDQLHFLLVESERLKEKERKLSETILNQKEAIALEHDRFLSDTEKRLREKEEALFMKLRGRPLTDGELDTLEQYCRNYANIKQNEKTLAEKKRLAYQYSEMLSDYLKKRIAGKELKTKGELTEVKELVKEAFFDRKEQLNQVENKEKMLSRMMEQDLMTGSQLHKDNRKRSDFSKIYLFIAFSVLSGIACFFSLFYDSSVWILPTVLLLLCISFFGMTALTLSKISRKRKKQERDRLICKQELNQLKEGFTELFGESYEEVASHNLSEEQITVCQIFRLYEEIIDLQDKTDDISAGEKNKCEFASLYFNHLEGPNLFTLERLKNNNEEYRKTVEERKKTSCQKLEFRERNPHIDFGKVQSRQTYEPEEDERLLHEIREEIQKNDVERQRLERIDFADGDLEEERMQYEDAIRQDNDSLREMEKQYRLTVKAKECLEKANISFQKGYMERIVTRFDWYVEKLLSSDLQQIHMNRVMKVETESYGKIRTAAVLSNGLKNLSYFCAKLALTDCLFESEKPPLILDDPFTSLDEDNTRQMKELLREIGSEYQVIHFVCHPCRLK